MSKHTYNSPSAKLLQGVMRKVAERNPGAPVFVETPTSHLSDTDAAIMERVRMRFAGLVSSQCPATRAIGYHAIYRLSAASDGQDSLVMVARTAATGRGASPTDVQRSVAAFDCESFPIITRDWRGNAVQS